MSHRILAAFLLALAAALSGCFSVGKPSPPIRYWVLSSPPGMPELGEGDRSVAVGPVELPTQLDRTNVVLRTGENRLEVLPLDQWGEPLEKGAARVIAENLTLEVPGLEGVVFPWSGGGETDARLQLFVRRLDLRRGEAVELIVTWLLRLRGEADARLVRTFSDRQPVEGDEVGLLVAALNRSLEKLAAELTPVVAQEVARRDRSVPKSVDAPPGAGP